MTSQLQRGAAPTSGQESQQRTEPSPLVVDISVLSSFEFGLLSPCYLSDCLKGSM